MKTARILSMLIFLFAVMLPCMAMADVIGKITAFQGNVDILRRGQERAAPVVRLEEPVSEGDILRTKSDGKAEITFIDESIIRLAPGSRLQITEYLMEGGKRKSGVMNLFRGKIRAVVSKSRGFIGAAFGGGARFEVRTLTAVAGVKGTDFFISYQFGVTSIFVIDGKMDVFNPAVPGQIVRVTTGNATFIAENKPPSQPRPANDVEIIRHTRDTDTGEKPKEKKGDETITDQTTADAGGDVFGFSAPDEGTPPPTTDTGAVATVLIPSSESHPELLADTIPPVVSIVSRSAVPLAAATADININFGSNETATYSYQLDGGTLTSTGSSLSLPGIAEGIHTINYTATDPAGNATSGSLPFNLSRYSLLGSASDTSGGVLGSVTSGEVAGISNQNWGGWINALAGTYTSMPSLFTLNAGGTSTDTVISNNGGYWIEVINGGSDGVSVLSGTSTFKYLSFDRLGTGIGTLTGSYGVGTWSATDTGTGTYTETPLAFSGNIGSAIKQELYNDGDGILGVGDTDLGLLGGTVPSLTNPADVTYMGQYTAPFSPAPYMWTPVIYSGNASTTFSPSYDNNKFWGYIGGVWEEGAIDGKVYSLYVDQNGDAGILKGSLAGAYYPDISMYSASGLWSPIKIVTGGVLQADLTDLTNLPNNTWNGINSSSGTITGTDSIFAGSIDGRRDSIANQPWGIWQAKVAGGFSLPITPPFTATQWSLTTQSFVFSSITPFPLETITGTQSDGTLWTINTGETIGKLLGTTHGYGADITTIPNTWISVGETIGTFDAAALTWQAVQTGAWMDTNRFLAMVAANDTATLTALNIPFAEVGRANLTGTNAQWTINMNNTTFFAYSNGAAPKIWATGDVNGSYNCSACGPTPVLTGNGLSANLNMQTWDTVGNKWIATVNGSGTYTGTGTMAGTNVIIEGAAAGTNTGIGPGTFSGTGAGVVK